MRNLTGFLTHNLVHVCPRSTGTGVRVRSINKCFPVRLPMSCAARQLLRQTGTVLTFPLCVFFYRQSIIFFKNCYSCHGICFWLGWDVLVSLLIRLCGSKNCLMVWTKSDETPPPCQVSETRSSCKCGKESCHADQWKQWSGFVWAFLQREAIGNVDFGWS